MSCGQCIRKVLKAAEPLTKHTLARADTHTHTHAHTHTKAPHPAITLTRPRQRHIQAHSHWDKYPETHTRHMDTLKPPPLPSQHALHVYLRGQGNSDVPKTQNQPWQTDPHNDTDTHRHTQSHTKTPILTALGSYRCFHTFHYDDHVHI